jgi:hypothetical protein
MARNKIFGIIFLSFLLGFLLGMALFGCSMITSGGDEITVTGTVRSVGNLPVNQWVIDSDDGVQYVIDAQYAQYAGYCIIVTGSIDGDTMYGVYLDIHDIDDVDE